MVGLFPRSIGSKSFVRDLDIARVVCGCIVGGILFPFPSFTFGSGPWNAMY